MTTREDPIRKERVTPGLPRPACRKFSSRRVAGASLAALFALRKLSEFFRICGVILHT